MTKYRRDVPPLEEGVTERVCEILCCTQEALRDALRAADSYTVFQKPKKRGGFRTIVLAPPRLQKLQKQIHAWLSSLYADFLRQEALLRTVHGFVTSRDALSNALVHRHGEEFFICDLADAYGQVTKRRVCEIFEYLGLTAEEAWVLATLTTFRGSIPQGVSSSPMLLNWACREMDSTFKQLGAGHSYTDFLGRVRYTRYADDLVFSSQSAALLDTTIPYIERTVRRLGFRLKAEKSRRLSLSAGAVIVTGLAINPLAFTTTRHREMPEQPAPKDCSVRLSQRVALQLRSFFMHAARGEWSQEEAEGVLGWVLHVYRGQIPRRLVKPVNLYREAVACGRVPRTKMERTQRSS